MEGLTNGVHTVKKRPEISVSRDECHRFKQATIASLVELEPYRQLLIKERQLYFNKRTILMLNSYFANKSHKFYPLVYLHIISWLIRIGFKTTV
jgi:hypothetical protein